MNRSTLFSLAPTFPLDDVEIKRLGRDKILSSPITWSAVVGSVILGAFISPWAIATFLGVSVFGLNKYWKNKKPEITAESIMKLISDSNSKQDEEMLRIIRVLDRSGYHQYAISLSRFLSLKQKIEKSLHSIAYLKPYAEEIENLVDGICIEVCKEITAAKESTKGLGDILTSRDESQLDRFAENRREIHASILHAYTSLYHTYSGLNRVGKSAQQNSSSQQKIRKSEHMKHMKQMIEDLRDEADFLSRLSTRIDESLVSSEGDEFLTDERHVESHLK